MSLLGCCRSKLALCFCSPRCSSVSLRPLLSFFESSLARFQNQSVTSLKGDVLAFGLLFPEGAYSDRVPHSCPLHCLLIIKPWWITAIQIFIWRQHLWGWKIGEEKENVCIPFDGLRAVCGSKHMRVCVYVYLCAFIGCRFGSCTQKDRQVPPSRSLTLPSSYHGLLGSGRQLLLSFLSDLSGQAWQV